MLLMSCDSRSMYSSACSLASIASCSSFLCRVMSCTTSTPPMSLPSASRMGAADEMMVPLVPSSLWMSITSPTTASPLFTARANGHSSARTVIPVSAHHPLLPPRSLVTLWVALPPHMTSMMSLRSCTFPFRSATITPTGRLSRMVRSRLRSESARVASSSIWRLPKTCSVMFWNMNRISLSSIRPGRGIMATCQNVGAPPRSLVTSSSFTITGSPLFLALFISSRTRA